METPRKRSSVTREDKRESKAERQAARQAKRDKVAADGAKGRKDLHAKVAAEKPEREKQAAEEAAFADSRDAVAQQLLNERIEAARMGAPDQRRTGPKKEPQKTRTVRVTAREE